MTDDQEADIKNRTAIIKGLADVLQASLLMIGVYEEMESGNEIVGAKQAACAAMTKIEENLTVLRGYCS